MTKRMARRESPWRGLATEAAHGGSSRLDRLGAARLVARMQAEDRRVLEALRRARTQIVRAAEALRETFASGGDCLIFGAGTSGRLGVLEAAELPPALLVHGAADTVVPPTMAEEFVAAYARAGGLIELAKFPREGHRFMSRPAPNTRRAISAMKSFISRQLQALADGDAP